VIDKHPFSQAGREGGVPLSVGVGTIHIPNQPELLRSRGDATACRESMDSWSMPVRSLGVSFEGGLPVDNTYLAEIKKLKYPARGRVKLSA
jgi:hypothetical protein